MDFVTISHHSTYLIIPISIVVFFLSVIYQISTPPIILTPPFYQRLKFISCPASLHLRIKDQREIEIIEMIISESPSLTKDMICFYPLISSSIDARLTWNTMVMNHWKLFKVFWHCENWISKTRVLNAPAMEWASTVDVFLRFWLICLNCWIIWWSLVY